MLRTLKPFHFHSKQFATKQIFEGLSTSLLNFRCCTTSTCGSPLTKKEEKLKFEKWLQMFEFSGGMLPYKMSDEHFEILMQKQTTAQKRAYISSLIEKEYKGKLAIREKAKLKEEMKIIVEERFREKTSGHIAYGLWCNTMFIKSNMDNLFNHRMVSAMSFGQPILIDMGFEDEVREEYMSTLTHDIFATIMQNRKHDTPLNLILCNVDSNSQVQQNIIKLLPPNFPVTFLSDNYLDLYPKKDLVYLSPDSKSEMRKFNPQNVYILGAIAEKGQYRPLTLAKAKRDGIRTARLPLDQHVTFRKTKVLSVSEVTSVLLDLQEENDWKKSLLQNIPKHLLMSQDSKPKGNTKKNERKMSRLGDS